MANKKNRILKTIFTALFVLLVDRSLASSSDYFDFKNGNSYDYLLGTIAFSDGSPTPTSAPVIKYYDFLNDGYEAYKYFLPAASSYSLIKMLQAYNVYPGRDVLYFKDGLMSRNVFALGDAGSYYGLSYFTLNTSDLIINLKKGDYMISINDSFGNEMFSYDCMSIHESSKRYVIKKTNSSYSDKSTASVEIIDGKIYHVIYSKANLHSIVLKSEQDMVFNCNFYSSRFKDEPNNYIVLGNKDTVSLPAVDYHIYKQFWHMMQFEQIDSIDLKLKQMANSMGIYKKSKFNFKEFRKQIMIESAKLGNINMRRNMFKNANWQFIDPYFESSDELDVEKKALFFYMNNINFPSMVKMQHDRGIKGYFSFYDNEGFYLNSDNEYSIMVPESYKGKSWKVSVYNTQLLSLVQNKSRISYLKGSQKGAKITLSTNCEDRSCIELPRAKNFFVRVDLDGHDQHREIEDFIIKRKIN